MRATSIEVGIDCADPGLLLPFWRRALGYEPDSSDARALSDPAGDGPTIWFQQVPEGKVVKNRLHLDVYLDDEPAALARRDELVEHGATAVRGFVDFWLMQDPEGNEFCLCWPPPAQSTGSA